MDVLDVPPPDDMQTHVGSTVGTGRSVDHILAGPRWPFDSRRMARDSLSGGAFGDEGMGGSAVPCDSMAGGARVGEARGRADLAGRAVCDEHMALGTLPGEARGGKDMGGSSLPDDSMGRGARVGNAGGRADLDGLAFPVQHVSPGTDPGPARGVQDLARCSLPLQAGGECLLGRGGVGCCGCGGVPAGRGSVDLGPGDLRRRARGRAAAAGTLRSRAAPFWAAAYVQSTKTKL